jgi:hypothetical protein
MPSQHDRKVEPKLHFDTGRLEPPRLLFKNKEIAMPKFMVQLQQYVEETALVEIEADTVSQAIELAEQMYDAGEVDNWEDGWDVVRGLAVDCSDPALRVFDETGAKVWDRADAT